MRVIHKKVGPVNIPKRKGHCACRQADKEHSEMSNLLRPKRRKHSVGFDRDTLPLPAVLKNQGSKKPELIFKI
jgi:hypothetical protein